MEHGKKVCNELKRVRQEIADANGIAYSPAVCDHKGDCDGTCPACEEEVKYIEQKLVELREQGKEVVVDDLHRPVGKCEESGSDSSDNDSGTVFVPMGFIAPSNFVNYEEGEVDTVEDLPF